MFICFFCVWYTCLNDCMVPYHSCTGAWCVLLLLFVESTPATAPPPANSYTSSQFAPPTNTFAPPTSSFAPPSSIFAPPTSSFAPPFQPSSSNLPPSASPKLGELIQEEQRRSQAQWEEHQNRLKAQQEQQLHQLRERQEQWLQQQKQLLTQVGWCTAISLSYKYINLNIFY